MSDVCDEEGGEKEFASATVHGEGDLRNYAFTFRLAQHFEFATALQVSGKVLLRNNAVGNLVGLLVDRAARPRHNFHELCDAESAELQELGCQFCDSDGYARAGEIDGLKGLEDGDAASFGGFLYLREVHIEEAHRHKDVGISFVRALMLWLNEREAAAAAERKRAGEARKMPGNGASKADITAYFNGMQQEWGQLHSSWSLCVLQSGALRWQSSSTLSESVASRQRLQLLAALGGSARPDATQAELEEEAADAAADTAALNVANAKIRRQWVRLGFRQAAFGSENWYLTPSCLTLLSKKAAAKVKITELPERREVCAEDKPLVSYLHRCGAWGGGGRPPTFAKDVKRLVTEGARPGRVCALSHAVANGITSAEDLGLLCALGASVHDKDEHGHTALHALINLLGKAAEQEEPALEAAAALLALGASRTAQTVYGHTPLDLLRTRMRDFADMRGVFGHLPAEDDVAGGAGGGGGRRDEDRVGFELAVLLLGDAQRAQLIGGVLTPRQHFRMKFSADLASDASTSEVFPLNFRKGERLGAAELSGGVKWFEFLPLRVRQGGLYESFVVGWDSVLKAVQALVERRVPPTADAVRAELERGVRSRLYESRYVDHFIAHGGKCEYAVDGLLHECSASELFFEIAEEDAAYGEADGWMEMYDALPEHPFDDWWDFVRHRLVGPRSKFRKGPFRDPAGPSWLDADEDEDEDDEDGDEDGEYGDDDDDDDEEED